jgi:hypothetical protein
MRIRPLVLRAWVVAFACRFLAAASGLAAAEAGSILVKDLVHFSDIQNREPMIAELADGSLLVTGFPRYPHEPPRAPSLWRSGDGAQSWSRVDVGSPEEGAIGNSDTDLALVTPLQDPRDDRMGFSFWRLAFARSE